MAKKRTWYQVTIRDLLAGSLIVALALLLGVEQTKRRGLETRISELMPAPQMRIYNPVPLTDKYWTQGTIGISGQLSLPAGYMLSGSPTVEVKLFDPSTGKPVIETSEKLIENEFGYGFNCNIRQEGLVAPGKAPMTVNVLDDGKIIARSATVVQFVDL